MYIFVTVSCKLNIILINKYRILIIVLLILEKIKFPKKVFYRTKKTKRIVFNPFNNNLKFKILLSNKKGFWNVLSLNRDGVIICSLNPRQIVKSIYSHIFSIKGIRKVSLALSGSVFLNDRFVVCIAYWRRDQTRG